MPNWKIHFRNGVRPRDAEDCKALHTALDRRHFRNCRHALNRAGHRPSAHGSYARRASQSLSRIQLWIFDATLGVAQHRSFFECWLCPFSIIQPTCGVGGRKSLEPEDLLSAGQAGMSFQRRAASWGVPLDLIELGMSLPPRKEIQWLYAALFTTWNGGFISAIANRNNGSGRPIAFAIGNFKKAEADWSRGIRRICMPCQLLRSPADTFYRQTES